MSRSRTMHALRIALLATATPLLMAPNDTGCPVCVVVAGSTVNHPVAVEQRRYLVELTLRGGSASLALAGAMVAELVCWTSKATRYCEFRATQTGTVVVSVTAQTDATYTLLWTEQP